MKIVLGQTKRQEDEITELKTLVTDMGETLRDLKKATTLWQKAEKMGFTGLESEEKKK